MILGTGLAALMVFWAVDGGGYDAGTWYPSALGLLSALAALLVAGRRPRLGRSLRLGLLCLGLYVAWSYLSIAWAGSPGDALDGSNRALLYLIVFALAALLPWNTRAALATVGALAGGIGALAIVILTRLALGSHVGSLLLDGRLAAPTGYFNASVALFTTGALLCLALALLDRLPALARGAFVALAAACLQLDLVGQSRGWLLTLPLVAVAAVLVAPRRLRLAAVTLPAVLAAVIPVHALVAIFGASSGPALTLTAERAGRLALVLCALAFIAVSVAGWALAGVSPRPLSVRARRVAGGLVIVLAVLACGAGAVLATHGHPVSFLSRQWRGFTSPVESGGSGSHFATVGSGRYDFWRVSLKALAAHPLGGLGQDNFADYYIRHRRTSEQPSWTHSLEMRLLAQTGLIGFLLFAAFLACALRPAWAAVRRGARQPAVVAAAALMPLIVWLLHGSVDWFWEFPALSGPALAGLAIAARLGEGALPAAASPPAVARSWRPAVAAAAGAALLGAVLVLGAPFLAVHEESAAAAARPTDPPRALESLRLAARLDPLSAAPGRLAGTIALQTGDDASAQRWFTQVLAREPGGWFGWLGAGLAASALGDRARARRDFETAGAIDRGEPAIEQALARVDSRHPLTALQDLALLTLVH